MHVEDQPPLFDPELNNSEKQVVSVFRMGNDVEIVKYQWKDGKLVEVSKETIDYSELTED